MNIMTGRPCDIAIAGGGLSGGMIALALRRARPELAVKLVDAGDTLGGNHRWSWFETDLDDYGHQLLSTFRKTSWDNGYDVLFPKYRRTLKAGYNSLASSDFHATLVRELADDAVVLNREIAEVRSDGLQLANGETISARTVIDCRGFDTTEHLCGGWQVFMGRHIHTHKPHGIARPVIMDAAVDQLAPAENGGAYRFVYTLPLGAHELFVEDTYYADSPFLDRSALSRRIDEYCAARGWDHDILGGETGVLPVITGGSFARHQQVQEINGVALAGARGGFVHPLTSYTLPFAIHVARLVSDNADLTGDQLGALLSAHGRNHWRSTKIYRRLGKMLFGAAKPELRYRIFERFYGLSEKLIERFYAGKSTRADKARVLIGRPPVSIARALVALGKSGKPLKTKRQ